MGDTNIGKYHVDKTPAKLDLQDLPAGHGFGFELPATDTTSNKSKPIMDRVTLAFDSAA